MGKADSLSLKSEILDIFEIAEINLLLSIKGLTRLEAEKSPDPSINSIHRIFTHCTKQLDKYVSKYTSKLNLPETSLDLILESGFSFGQSINAYLSISNEFKNRLGETNEVDLGSPLNSGEKLVSIIKRVSLHFCGHMGQISLIRKLLDNAVEGPYSFIKAMSKPTRTKLRKEWDTWWEDNKAQLI